MQNLVFDVPNIISAIINQLILSILHISIT